jgi:predicted ATP-grasp superfamily ATP-dependent carboligase
MNEIGLNPAVVLGADVNALGHIRSLGKKGIPTYSICTGSKNDNPDNFSKYSVPVYVLENKSDYEANLLNTLINLSKSFKKKPVLYATSDYFIDFITLNRSSLEKHYLFNIPSRNIIKIITSKYSTDKAARSSGLESPTTIRYKDRNFFAHVTDTIGFPCLLKPIDSFTCSFPGKNQCIQNRRKLAVFIEQHPELKNHIIAQEIIPGSEDSIFQCTVYIGLRGQIQFFTMQKIHQYPPGYGTTSLGRSISITSLREKTKRILRDIGYTGFASVEFKKSTNTNDYYLIEINPRLPWYNSLFDSCGVNFPYLAYLDLTENDAFDQTIVLQKENIYWLHLRNEVRGLWKRKKAGIDVNIAQYLGQAIKARSFAYFDCLDLRPFFESSFKFFRLEICRFFSELKKRFK